MRCTADISGVKPVSKEIVSATISSQNLSDSPSIHLITPEGRAIKITDNCCLGREETGKEFLSDISTVGRKHAQFIFQSDKWIIKDCQSKNGTYLNGERLEQGKEYEIKDNDVISLSSRIKLIVHV